MSTKVNSHRSVSQASILISAIGATMLAAMPALAQPKAPAPAGLAAILADDQIVIAELARRDLVVLRDHLFKKNNVSPEQQAAYLALSSLKRLSAKELSPRQKQELVRGIAAGIDPVLATIRDPAELMKLAAALIETGTKPGLNLLEYWGEDLRIQSQVRPVAEAVARIYDKAITLAKTQEDEIANRMNNAANQQLLTPQWEKAAKTGMMAKFNAPHNLYALALSIDKANPRRQTICEQAIKMMTEFEDDQYEVAAAAKLCIGKLEMAKGTQAGVAEAKKKFAEAAAEAKADWTARFEAAYFTAVAGVVGRDLPGANSAADAVEKYLAANPAPTPEAAKAMQAAVKMLRYRILTLQAETAQDDAAAKANQAAVAMLQALLKDQPELEGIINRQIIARLPADADVSKLDDLLLKAVAARGNDEVAKPIEQQADVRTLEQAVAAARQIIKRAGGKADEDVQRHTLRLGLFYARLGRDLEAANAFLDHVEKFHSDLKLAGDVLDNAATAVGRLKRDRADQPGTQDTYLRFLGIATKPPFERNEFNFEYGFQLLQRNSSLMEGSYDDAQKTRMIAAAREAADLFSRSSDEKLRLQAWFYEMLAHDQLLDLDPQSNLTGPWIEKIQALADKINTRIAQELPNTTDEAAKLILRKYHVRTALLAAALAKHQQGPKHQAGLERALVLLADFETDVQGLSNANALLSEALLMRLQSLLELSRADEALKNLGKFLETRTDEQGLDVVIQMIESLGKEFDQAQKNNNTSRMTELAGHRAGVSRYLVERAAASKNAQTRALLPKYRMFQANSLQEAARLESDAGKRKGYLDNALAIYQTALKEAPDDRGLQLAVAFVEFDRGNYIQTQKTLSAFLTQHLLGKPMVMVSSAEGEQMKPNNQYWNALAKLLRANVELVKQKAPGFDQSVLDQTKRMLQQVFITWGDPGGPRWVGQFNDLRKEILPDWTPPTLGGSTQPAN